MATLDVFRSTVGAAALGMARRALDEALGRVRERQLFGAPMAELPLVQAKLGEMALGIDASALLVYRAAWTKDAGGGRVTREAAMAKLHATETAQRMIDDAVQLFGGLGVTVGAARRAPVPRGPGAAHLRGRVGGPEADHRAGHAQRGESRMRFVLVHGSWHDGSLLEPVAVALRGLGHDVTTPTLAGHGPGADVNINHDDLVRSLVVHLSDFEDVVLVGHSFGGTVIARRSS